MFIKFKKYVETHGIAKAAFLMGYKDTPVLKNWLHRKEIPVKCQQKVKALFKTTVTVTQES